MQGTTTDEGIMFVYRAIRVKLWYLEYFPVLEKLFGFKHGLEALKLYPGHAGTDNRLQLSVSQQCEITDMNSIIF